jgi:uncharacterized protein
MKFILLVLIRAYRFFISPLLGANCRFSPTCSAYAETSVRRFGALKGLYLSVKRIIKCHPFHAGGFDPVPDARKE